MDLRHYYPIREAKRDEWEDAMSLAWTTFMKFEADDYSKEGVDSFLDFISDEKLYRMFLIGEYHVFVAVDDDKIIGVISLRARTHISLLFVDERYHHRGVGRNLVNYAAMFVREENKGRIITVNSSPYAENFYRRLGFKDTDSEQQKDGIIYTPMSLSIE